MTVASCVDLFVRAALAVRIPCINQAQMAKNYNSRNSARQDVERRKPLRLMLEFMQRIARGAHSVAED